MSDVTVRAARGPAPAHAAWSALAYNTLGPARWDLMTCSAMVPGGGGLAVPRSLLPHSHQYASISAGGAPGGACETCATPALATAGDREAKKKK